MDAWNKTEFGHVGRTIFELQDQLEGLELQPLSLEVIQAMRSTWIDLNYWLEKEDAMWRQRSRINWFQSGDKNTTFFHAKASAKQKRNFIEGLLDANEVWQEDENKIKEIVMDYYTNLFTSSNPSNFEELFQAV